MADLAAIREHWSGPGEFISGGHYEGGWDSVWLETDGGEALDALLAHIEVQQRRIEELEAEIERQKSAYLKERAKLREQQSENDRLRELLQAWEPRVICPQCGQRYHERACGPTHAVIYNLVNPQAALSERPK